MLIIQIERLPKCTAEIDMAKTVSQCGILDLLMNAAWAILSTYCTVLKASLSTVIFGWDMMFDLPLIADWN